MKEQTAKNKAITNLSEPNRARFGLSGHPAFDKMISPLVMDTINGLAAENNLKPDHLKTHGGFWPTFPGFQGQDWKPPVAIASLEYRQWIRT